MQEVAFTLANAIAYVEAALQAGLPVDDFAPQLAFFFNAHNNFLEEVAKFRAARRLWARIMRDRFGARDPRSLMLRFHTQTGGSTLTAQQPENNVVRVTVQALAAVLGGTQSLHTNSMDEALGLPTERGGPGRAAHPADPGPRDPAWPTRSIRWPDPTRWKRSPTRSSGARSSTCIERIDELGGALAAIEQGYPQGEIQEAAYQAQRAIESGRQIVVGVKHLPTPGRRPAAPTIAPQPVDPAVESGQRERLAQLRAARDDARESGPARPRRARGAHDGAADPALCGLPAVEAGATLGELCGYCAKCGENTVPPEPTTADGAAHNTAFERQLWPISCTLTIVALVVEDLDRRPGLLARRLGLPFANTETLPEQQAEIAFLPLGESRFELVRPTNSQFGHRPASLPSAAPGCIISLRSRPTCRPFSAARNSGRPLDQRAARPRRRGKTGRLHSSRERQRRPGGVLPGTLTGPRRRGPRSPANSTPARPQLGNAAVKPMRLTAACTSGDARLGPGSAPLPLGLALGQERLHALLLVCRVEEEVERAPLIAEPIAQAGLIGPVDRLLAQADGEGRARGDLLRQLRWPHRGTPRRAPRG